MAPSATAWLVLGRDDGRPPDLDVRRGQCVWRLSCAVARIARSRRREQAGAQPEQRGPGHGLGASTHGLHQAGRLGGQSLRRSLAGQRLRSLQLRPLQHQPRRDPRWPGASPGAQWLPAQCRRAGGAHQRCRHEFLQRQCRCLGRHVRHQHRRDHRLCRADECALFEFGTAKRQQRPVCVCGGGGRQRQPV